MNHCHSKRSSTEAQHCCKKGRARLGSLFERGTGFECVAMEGLERVCVSPFAPEGIHPAPRTCDSYWATPWGC